MEQQRLDRSVESSQIANQVVERLVLQPRMQCGDLIVIVGAGMQAIAAANLLRKRGMAYIMLERQGSIGGIWVSEANDRSMAQTESGTYHLDLDFERVEEMMSTYPSRSELMNYFTWFVKEHGIDKNIRLRHTVTNIVRLGKNRVAVEYEAHGRQGCIRASHVMVFPGRLAIPRSVVYP